MIFMSGIKSLIRQPGKTISFFLLLLFVALFLVLSVSMKVSSENLLSEADRSFLTIATVEYKGENYPDDIKYDAAVSTLQASDEFKRLVNADGIKSYEPYIELRGYTGEYGSKINKQFENVTPILFKPNGLGEFVLLKAYRENDDFIMGGSFHIYSEGLTSDLLKTDHVYMALGEYVTINGSSSFTPCYFYTNQVKLTDEQTNAILRNKNGKESNIAYKFFLTDSMLERISDEGETLTAEEYYKNIYDEFKLGPFIDVTKEYPGAYTEFVYDEEWTAAQTEKWAELYDSPEAVSMGWESLMYAATQSYEIMSNSVNVVMINNVEYEPLFHQHMVSLSEGRYYTENDGKNVCIVSSVYANMQDVGVGDIIAIDLHNAATGADFYNSYFYASGYKYSAEYKIVGVYKNTDDIGDRIFIPVQEGGDSVNAIPHTEPKLPSETNNYCLGTFVLENTEAAFFTQNIKELLPEKCAVTVYDQGYINIAAPLISMSETSMLLIGVCMFSGLCIIMLFAYIFITKQGITAKTMLNLGTGNGKTLMYLMCGTTVLVLAACAAGAVIGYFISDNVLTYAYDLSAKNSITDLSFSTLRTSAENKPFNLSFNQNVVVIAITSAAVILFATVICALFANRIIISPNRSKPQKNKKTGKSDKNDRCDKSSALIKTESTDEADKNTTASSMTSINKNEGRPKHNPIRRIAFMLKNSIRNMLRMPGRSVIVPVVSLAIIILISVFCSLLQSYTDNIDNLYRTIPVKGQFLTLNGRSNDGLLLDTGELAEFINKGYLEDIDYSFSGERYKLLGYYETNDDGTAGEFVSNLGIDEDYRETMPVSPFAAERFKGELMYRAQIVLTTSMNNSPEFFGTGVKTVEFLDGYDHSVFLSDEDVCIVPRNVISEYEDITLGSVIRLSVSLKDSRYNYYNITSVNLKVVGITDDITNKIYMPMYAGSLYRGIYGVYSGRDEVHMPPWMTPNYPNEPEQSEDEEAYGSITEMKIKKMTEVSRVSAFCFTLKNGYAVAPLKEYLSDNGYSYPAHIGQIRRCLVIDDAELNNSINSLIKVKGYLEVLYPVIYVIIIATAFVVSYLLVRTRVADIAIMRSMGSGKAGTLLALFVEQFILVCVGALLGGLISFAIYGSLTTLQTVSIGLYVLCYTVGLIIAICAINSVNVLRILSSKD